MGIVSLVKQSPIVHIWLFCIHIISALIVTSGQLFTLVLWPFSKSWYRRINGYLINLMWLQCVWLTDYWSGSRVHFYGRPGLMETVSTHHSLLVVNHKEDVDWLVIWQIAERFKMLRGAKCLMKQEIKYVPFYGWSFWLTEQLFVNRDYAKDKTSLMKQLENVTTYDFPTVTLIFCEGTRYTKEKYEKSQAFARENGLPGLKHHLVPRTKGFNLCIEAFKGKVPVIFDVTIAYQDNKQPSIYDLVCGKKFDFHFYVRDLPLDEVPTDSEEATAQYCHDIYKQKDEAYDYFLRNNTFEGYDVTRPGCVPPPTLLPLVVMSLWMLFVGVPIIYYSFAMLFSGSTVMIVTICGGCYAVFRFSKSMMRVSDVTKGSTYGSSKETKSKRSEVNDTGSGVTANGDQIPLSNGDKKDS
ncbi:1-acyl-sn-glycerol-3-phosphate acyltransferase delta-like [Lytechinus pictus]|uniref:1-acyl-sn-glycerol-3-phosphate acyltransferase delta-like n=1 Tax=Lytechinus pictus TaxID=7653 RepID=UPI00240DDF50|nr:1-acyl-sn-glycerol-3-phosphate acyltransferase delta-like [Lytechinus pictus]